MFSFLNLSSIWLFLSPIITDLLKEGGKKALERAKKPSNRENFISLYITLGDFEENLKKFINIFEKYLTFSEINIYPREIVISGNKLADSLETLKKSLQKVFPEYEIYAQNSYCLLYFVIADEDLVLRRLISEFEFLPASENQFSNLLKENMDDSLIGYREDDFVDPSFNKNLNGWINVDDAGNMDKLHNLLNEAKENFTRTTVAIEDLRQFIKMNIPIKVD